MTITKERQAELEQKFGTAGPLSVRLEVKAVGTGTDRTFEGLAATWDLDLGDDIIEKGAFSATLKEWKSSGRPIKLLDSHSTLTIRSALGKLVAAKETDEGLWTKWEVIGGGDGDAALDRLRLGIVDSMSIGFFPVKWSFEENDAARFGVIRHLIEIDLKEVSLVLFPMNPAALIDTSTVKHRLLTGKYSPDELEGLKALHAALGAAISAAAPLPSDAVAAPDTTLLDSIRVRRLRLKGAR